HLLTAHVLAYGAIHAVRDDAVVATNGFAFSTYGLERLGTDVLTARLAGVARGELRHWLAPRRNRYEAALAGGGRLAGVVDRLIDLDRARPRTVAAVYASDHTCTLDHIQTDYYDPGTLSHFRVPGHQTAGGRHWGPDRML